MPFATLKGESIQTNLQLALLLRDGFARSGDLLGDVVVEGTTEKGRRQDQTGIFVFFNLKPGPQALSVASAPDTPYYLPRKVTVAVPNPPLPASLWPAFPDVTKADPDLMLDDPAQRLAYISERLAATLLPSTTYPFPEGTTLIRGSVTHANHPLADAVVRQIGSVDPSYRTGVDGAFVLFWREAPAVPEVVTIEASHATLASVSVDVSVARGLTVPVAIDM
jgi:hypothetical protein